MSRGLLIALVVVVVLVGGIVAWAISVNNQLVVLEQGVNEKWAQGQNVYQRRADLIPNLVETVKGFAAQERTVLEEVTRARASASSIQLTPQALNDPKALERFQAAQNHLSGTLSRPLVTAERERASGTQMAIAVFRSLEGESLEDVANALFQKWRLGRKGLDNGVLLVVFVQDRKLRLEVGYGLEALLPDAEAGRIIREAISPRFREQRYAAGLEAAVGAVYARIAPSSPRSPEQMQREAESWRRRRSESEGTARLYLLLFLAFAALTVGGLAWDASHQRR